MFAWVPEWGCTFACSAPKSLLDTVAREVLGLVMELAPAVVPLARVTLGVLVRHDRAHRFENGSTYEVLGGDQLEPVYLADPLAFDDTREFGVHIGKVRHINNFGARHV